MSYEENIGNEIDYVEKIGYIKNLPDIADNNQGTVKIGFRNTGIDINYAALQIFCSDRFIKEHCTSFTENDAMSITKAVKLSIEAAIELNKQLIELNK